MDRPKLLLLKSKLEATEEKAVLEAAARSRSRLIYPYLMTLAWTGMRSDEARTLRWSQVNFETGEILVGKAKTEAGSRRSIPIGAALKAALRQHAAWCASKLGPIEPDWYVFPLSNRIKPVDATRPATSLECALGGRTYQVQGAMPAARPAAFVLHEAGGSRGSRKHHA